MPSPFLIKRGEPLSPKTKAFLVIVVSKKVAPLATRRNLIKRRTRHIFRDLKPKLKLLNRKLVIIYHPGSAQIPFQELKQLIIADLKRLNYV